MPLAIPNHVVPVVAKSLASHWPACRLWTLDYLDEFLELPLKFRMSQRNTTSVQWEPDCDFVFASVGNFRDWLNGVSTPNNPFHQYSLEHWWAYADYVYMDSCKLTKLAQDIPWGDAFDLMGRQVSSTFWLGSSGANSICHYDTYGVNLVVQIFGKKSWTLFPPSDSPFLYETRVPLEESTVFSEVNFPTPDYTVHPLISKVSPRFVVMEPGDVLFVPRGWWHFVQSTSDSLTTCSVNWWIDQPELDDHIRLREALTQLIGFSLLTNCNPPQSTALMHPSEREVFTSADWFQLLSAHIRDLLSRIHRIDSSVASAIEVGPIWHEVPQTKIENLFPPTISLLHSLPPPASRSSLTVDIIKSVLKPNDADSQGFHFNPDRKPVIPGVPLRLKCKYPSGQCIITDLTSESSVRDLLNSLSSVVEVNPAHLKISVGYPPRRIICSDESLNMRLRQVPILSGDVLTVEPMLPPNRASTVLAESRNQVAHSHPVSTESAPHIVRLTAPSDNSCLFTSVLFCIENADGRKSIDTKVVTNTAAVAQMRELIASIVLSDPDRYSEGFLGMSNAEYYRSIQEPDRWGGGIEVAILSQVYEMEICVVDIQTGRIDRFGEDHNYQYRILLMYDGIHYDPLSLARPDTGLLTSVFSTSNTQVLWDAQSLAAEARAAWRFTDTASFTLICRQCQLPLIGQSAAQTHAKETGHDQFSEIPAS
ncbi:unnamed protein product [Dicrocoelium dendriticum]|nr:unnamed protein product [Dicrocoelium dendriticum]